MAQISISVPTAVVPRIKKAFAYMLEKDVKDVTLDDVKSYIVADLKQLVKRTEVRQAREALMPDAADIDIS